jgi:hypothetical protein
MLKFILSHFKKLKINAKDSKFRGLLIPGEKNLKSRGKSRWRSVTGIPATNYHMYYHMYYHLIAGTIATNYNRQGTLYRVTAEGSKIIHQARE